MSNLIKGLQIELVDPNTDALLTFHRIDNYTVDTRNNIGYVHIGSYVSKESYEAEKQPIMSTSMTVQNYDGTVHPLDWLYEGILTQEDSKFATATRVE